MSVTTQEKTPGKTQEKWILYSTCDEDSDSEMRALDIQPGNDVVSVTGSGCRTLSVVANHPASVVSVDTAPGQNYLLELKLAAIAHLDWDALLAFLGVEPSTSRRDTLSRLRPHLSDNAFRYFDRHPRAVSGGIIRTGRHERFYTHVVAPVLRLLYNRSLHRLVEAPTVAEQRRVYLEEIDGPIWRLLIRQGFSERVLKAVLNDPGYRITIDVDSVGGYVLERVHHSLTNHLVRENHWVTFMLTGHYRDRSVLPHYLLHPNYEAIRSAPTAVTPVTTDITSYLATLPARSVDRFSLSDVTSCIDREQFESLMREVVRTARPGARVCYRNFLAKHQVPDDVAPLVERDASLSSALTHDDKAFVYDLEVLTVRP